MRLSIAVFLLVFAAGFYSLLAGTNPPDQGHEIDLRWGLAAALFNLDSGEIAISRNISRTTMLLFSVGIGWSDVAEQRLTDGDSNISNYSLSIGPEFRRIYYRHPSVGVYAGFQPTVGYSRSNAKSSNPEIDFGRKSLSLGVNLTLGAEYEVINNLSVSIHFRPLRYAYSEVKDGIDSNVEQERTSKVHSLMFSQQTGLYVRIYF